MTLKRVRCPNCRGWASWTDNPFRPFCSEGCKKRDLGNWATEEYRIPVHKRQEVDDELEKVKVKKEGKKEDED